jgi:uncharacterized protein YebE (UPF0316 family)
MGLWMLCIKIFVVRILDVSLGTIRTIMTVKGKNLLAALIGFVEVTIWFLIVKDALNSTSNSLWIVFSYAGGYATGTYVGGYLSSKFIQGKLSVQIVIHEQHGNLVDILRTRGYAVSVVSAQGYEGSNKLILFLEINNHQLEDLEEIVKAYDNKAFVVVNETKYVHNGYFQNIAK